MTRKKPAILVNIVGWGLAIFITIGIVIIENVETIRAGYEIAELKKMWQMENCRLVRLKKLYNSKSSNDKVEKFVRKHFDLEYPEPCQIIFLENEKK